MNKANMAVLCIIMLLLGWSARGFVPLANAAPPEKVYDYMVKACGDSKPNMVAQCLNSAARDGWRVVAPFGDAFVIFER